MADETRNNEPKVRYSDEELQEFKEIILDMKKKKKKEYRRRSIWEQSGE